jgi:hypothetical protein
VEGFVLNKSNTTGSTSEGGGVEQE